MAKATVAEINDAIATLESGKRSYTDLLTNAESVKATAEESLKNAKTKADKDSASLAINDAGMSIANFTLILANYTETIHEMVSIRDRVNAGESVPTESLDASEESPEETETETIADAIEKENG